MFFFGHGGWDPRRQKTGFTTVPGGTTFSFYTAANTLMTLKFGYELIEGSASADPDQQFGPFQSCPDMTLYPAPEFHSQIREAMAHSGAEVIVAHQALRLSRLFQQYAGNDIVWIACRELILKPTGMAAPGLNRVGR
jgi:hypothetical protein